jgi:hypothetical protein
MIVDFGNILFTTDENIEPVLVAKGIATKTGTFPKSATREKSKLPTSDGWNAAASEKISYKGAEIHVISPVQKEVSDLDSLFRFISTYRLTGNALISDVSFRLPASVTDKLISFADGKTITQESEQSDDPIVSAFVARLSRSIDSMRPLIQRYAHTSRAMGHNGSKLIGYFDASKFLGILRKNTESTTSDSFVWKNPGSRMTVSVGKGEDGKPVSVVSGVELSVPDSDPKYYVFFTLNPQTFGREMPPFTRAQSPIGNVFISFLKTNGTKFVRDIRGGIDLLG